MLYSLGPGAHFNFTNLWFFFSFWCFESFLYICKFDLVILLLLLFSFLWLISSGGRSRATGPFGVYWLVCVSAVWMWFLQFLFSVRHFGYRVHIHGGDRVGWWHVLGLRLGHSCVLVCLGFICWSIPHCSGTGC